MRPILLVERDLTPIKNAGVEIVMPKFRVVGIEELGVVRLDSPQGKKTDMDEIFIPVSLDINGICASFVVALGD